MLAFEMITLGGVETPYGGTIQYSFTTIVVPGRTGNVARGINDSGQIVGSYSEGPFGPEYGFLYAGGSLTTIDVPGANSTEAHGINDSGQIAGSYADGPIGYAFLATPVPEPRSTLPLLAGCLIGLATILPKLRKS
jgi:probable HAF family extracellular repeat protein